MARLLFIPLVAALLLAPLAFWQHNRAQVARPPVVTSISVLADMVERVGGNRVGVTALVPRGDGPEDYDPTPADAANLANARVFFANGLGLEDYLTDLVADSGNDQLEVVTLSEGLPVLTSFGQGAEEGGNPHLWLNPRYAVAYVETIRQTLSRIDPEGESSYAENAARYTQELLALDAYVELQVQSLPPSARVLVTTHDAYPYFAERYGFVYLAAIRGGHDSDPSAREYAALVTAVQDNGVRAVFGEAGFSDRFVSQLAADTGATYVADLYTDTLSDGPPAATYLDAMQYNVDAIVGALR